MTEVVEPKLEFKSLTEDAILAALADPDPELINPVAVEVFRLVAAYKKNFRDLVKNLGYLPPHVLHRQARWPIEAVALRLAKENIREIITQPPEK